MANSYIIRDGLQGRERLRILARVMRRSTLALLDRVGIREGMHCLDIGCGGGDVSLELGARTGSTGRVLGIDRDPVSVEIAGREAAALGLGHIAYWTGDILAGELPDERFDIVYMRFLLTHLAEPERAIDRMRGLLRPNGLLVVEDIDFAGHFIHPQSSAFVDYLHFHREAARLRGADSDIGPRLPAMLEAAGIGPIQMQVAQPAGLRGEVKLIAAITMQAIGPAVVSSGLADEARVTALTDELFRLAEDETTVMSTVRVVQVWGGLMA